MFVDYVIYILVTQNVFHGSAASVTLELGKMQTVTPHLRPTELESVYLTSLHTMCRNFEAEKHCSRWELLLGTGVSERHGKIFFHHTKGKMWLKLVHWGEDHASTRTILCCKKCEIIWKVEESKHITWHGGRISSILGFLR